MDGHGIAYIWLFFLLIQSCDAAVENLPEGSKTFRQAFTPNSTTKPWVWYTWNGVGSYSICKSQQSWLVTEKFNTTNIKEVLFELEFTIGPINSTNKSLILVSVITGNVNNVFNITGKKLGNSGRFKGTRLLQLNSRQTQFGIQPSDKENCFIVYSAKITYNYCPETTIAGLAHFPRTISPGNGSLPVKVKGTCSGGRRNKKPHAFCARNGNWSQNKTIPCDCQPGLIKTFSGCIKLTYTIQEIKVIRQSKRQAVLSWKAQENIHYDIRYKKCVQGQCNFHCSELKTGVQVKLQGTKQIIVRDLEQGNGYIFTVCATIKVVGLNDSAVDIKTWNGSVMLRELPGKVRNISYTSKEANELVLSWQPPINWFHINVSYKVTCKVYCFKANCSQRCAKLEFIPSSDNLLQTNVTVKGFGNDAERYLFTIFTKDLSHDFSENIGQMEWNFNAINYTVEIRKNITSDSKAFNVVDVIIGVSVLVLAVIITIVVTKCYNRWKVRKHTINDDDEHMDNLCEVPSNTTSSAHYVDPSNYESVKSLIGKFTMKLNEKYLKTDEIIGEGEFGIVWGGYLDVPDKEQVIVAVKCLRSGLSTKLRRDFLKEASVMGQFNDPNVISLHGVVVKKSTVKIVMEFMFNGSLDKYLLNNNNRLTTLQLLGMARGIASGMKYLSGRNFIHRDLAARNILVDSNLCCKVSDFGLMREIYPTSNYETRGGKIPIRWTAPEVIKHKKSFIASDVWSFGVVLWEIMSFGQRPYWDWDNFQVLQEIESGYRLPVPLKCPKSVHLLMLDCWEKDRTKRPLFSYIVDNLDEWIRSPETIDQSPTLVKKKDHVIDVSSQSPIQQWLNSIKMGKYALHFRNAGYSNINDVTKLTDEDLLAIGITLVGHRHKIYQSIPLVAKSQVT